jgi:hypothetical protein
MNLPILPFPLPLAAHRARSPVHLDPDPQASPTHSNSTTSTICLPPPIITSKAADRRTPLLPSLSISHQKTRPSTSPLLISPLGRPPPPSPFSLTKPSVAKTKATKNAPPPELSTKPSKPLIAKIDDPPPLPLLLVVPLSLPHFLTTSMTLVLVVCPPLVTSLSPSPLQLLRRPFPRGRVGLDG